MHFTVYRTTNKINGRFYVGVHRTENPEDEYLGSGTLLAKAIQKHGRSSFAKDVLFIFDNAEEMEAKEAEIVTVDFVNNPRTYNLVPGGYQGDSYYQALKQLDPKERRRRAKAANAEHQRLMRTDPEYREAWSRKASAGMMGRAAVDSPRFSGRKHSEETKAKMRASFRWKQSGKNNSQFGTCWVCREGEAPRKIKKTELPAFEEAGWQRGRKVSP